MATMNDNSFINLTLRSYILNETPYTQTIPVELLGNFIIASGYDPLQSNREIKITDLENNHIRTVK
jgi:hypothetical protein